MSQMIPDFDAKLSAFLDDDEAAGLLELDADGQPVHRFRPSDGAIAAQKAYDEADSHALCPRDDRDYSVLVSMYGHDRVETIISIPPERSLGCVLRAMYEDDDVVAYKILGAEPPVGPLEDDMDDDSSGGIVVTSLVPGMVASWDAGQPYLLTTPWRRALLSTAVAATAALIAWRFFR